MFLKRLLQLPKNHSFFLLGPRGAGKSTLVKKQFDHESCVIFDLLEAKLFPIFYTASFTDSGLHFPFHSKSFPGDLLGSIS